MTPTSQVHCSPLKQSRCHTVIEDCMFFFAAYTAAETPNAFQWAEQLSKSSLPVGIPTDI